MEKHFCTYEISLFLKELGFDENCLAVYHKGEFWLDHQFTEDAWCEHSKNSNFVEGYIATPLISQALEYFREKHNILIDITDRSGFLENKKFIYCISVLHTNTILYKSGSTFGFEDDIIDFETYEEAQEQALLKVIEICKEKK